MCGSRSGEQKIKSMGDPDDLLHELIGQCPWRVDSASTRPASRQNFRIPVAIIGAQHQNVVAERAIC